jgi:uncharacterized secreted protein with C-terminal beta-propeller domain
MATEDPKYTPEETEDGLDRARDLYELAKRTMRIEVETTVDDPVNEDTRF